MSLRCEPSLCFVISVLVSGWDLVVLSFVVSTASGPGAPKLGGSAFALESRLPIAAETGHMTTTTTIATTTTTAPQQSPNTGRPPPREEISIEEIIDGSWSPDHRPLAWIPGIRADPNGWLLDRTGHEGELARVYHLLHDGYLDTDCGSNPMSQTPHNIIKLPQERVNGLVAPTPDDLWISPDLHSALLVFNKTKTWRHSFTGLYWMLDLETGRIEPLDPSVTDSAIRLAEWSPRADPIAFVRGNDLYVRKLDNSTKGTGVRRITEDGNHNLLYGVPDWVYEEEVLEGRKALWLLGTGRYLAFLQTNCSSVGTHTMQHLGRHPHRDVGYLPGIQQHLQYTSFAYPRPGTPNPVVS
ncbi:Putative dipeptidylpeptidase IV domain-containing protein [Colletotrichum destructivum]|uniref:Dipeptidylpeptidase IV domain-containing protein n=1 Tax=Colletotrichum destructivum TaxID=34406 RepID=A0AAX4J3W1_9PEZI|nr:Putative dipeptidylpeptidase IV domain-containing protein [Colletotrichum destructivum]